MIEEKFPALGEQHPELLARQWTEADETERAIAEWEKAGKAAEGRNAFSEALASYEQALALLNLIPESPERDRRELAVRFGSLYVLHVAKGSGAPETMEANTRAIALAEKTGNLAQLANVMIAKRDSLVELGDLSAATALADEALAIALSTGDQLVLKRARRGQLALSYFRGDLANLEEHFAAARNLFEQPDMDSMMALGYANMSAAFLGRAEVARQRLSQMRRAVNQNNQWEIAFTEMWTALFYALTREYARAAPFAERALDLSEQFQLTQVTIQSRAFLGHVRTQLGQAGDGIALIRQGIADASKSQGVRRFLTFLASAQQQAGAIEDALESIEQSLLVHPEVLISRPEALRVRGELWLEKGLAELAEADFRDSIALARSMGARMLELRSTVSLSRLLASQGLHDEARAILGEIYSWFTEGFDTPDLKDAKARLDELGA